MKIEAFDAPSKMVPYLLSVERGKQDVLRSAIYKDIDAAEASQAWLNIMGANLDRLPKRLVDLEVKELGKVGPRSVQLPLKDRMKDIVAYYQHVDQASSEFISEIDVSRLSPSLNRKGRMRPIGIEKAVSLLPDNTNSGAPFFTRRSRVVRETVEMVKGGDYFHPAILGWRGQSNGTLIPKQRVVWMFSFATNAQETRYTRPVYDVIKNDHQFAAWISMDEVDIRMTHLMDSAEGYGTILSSDYSGFDQHIRDKLLSLFTVVMSSYYQPKFHAELKAWIDNILNVDLIISTKKKISGQHGLSSGSAATNLADSIVNDSVQMSSPQVACPLRLILGDDGVLRVWDVDRHLRFLSEAGLEVNPSKQMIDSSSAHYLQRLYMKDYRVDGYVRGIYPGARAIGNVLFTERYHDPAKWSKTMETIRWLSIAENCKWHPLFHELLLFLAKGDKYLKENLRLVVRNPVKLRAQAMSLPGFVPMYNDGAKGKGLLDYAAVKFLLEYYRI